MAKDLGFILSLFPPFFIYCVLKGGRRDGLGVGENYFLNRNFSTSDTLVLCGSYCIKVIDSYSNDESKGGKRLFMMTESFYF